MKQLLAFTALLAAGYALGNRRARTRGPVDVVRMAVEVDTSQATAALKELEARIERVHTVTVQLNGADLLGALELEFDRRGRVADTR